MILINLGVTLVSLNTFVIPHLRLVKHERPDCSYVDAQREWKWNSKDSTKGNKLMLNGKPGLGTDLDMHAVRADLHSDWLV